MARRKQISKQKSASSRSSATIFQELDSVAQLEEIETTEIEKRPKFDKNVRTDPEDVKFPFSLLYDFQDLLNNHLNFRKSVEIVVCLYFLQITYLHLKDDPATLLAIGFSVFGTTIAMHLTHRSLLKKHLENPEVYSKPELPEFNTIYAIMIPTLYLVMLDQTKTPFFQMNLALNNFSVKSMSSIPKILSSAVFYYMYNENETLEIVDFARVVWLYFSIQYVLSWWNERYEEEDTEPQSTLTYSEIHILSVLAVNLLCNFSVAVNETNIVLHIVRVLLLALIIAFAAAYPIYFVSQYFTGGLIYEIFSLTVVGVFCSSFYYATNYVFTRQVVNQEVISWLLGYIRSSEYRVQLLISWISVLAVAIPVLFFLTSLKWISLNNSRKIWHLLLAGALIYPALVKEPVFSAIAVSGSAFVFVVLEATRTTRLGYIGRLLHSILSHFQDEKDTKGPLNLSFIFLLIGVAVPILYSAAVDDLLSMRSFIGVITLGFSDSLASFVGGRFGKIKWKGGDRTLEGTMAHLVGTFGGFVIVDRFVLPGTGVNWENLFVLSLAAAILEGASTLNDNVLVPVMSLIMYEMLKKTFVS